MKSKKKELNFFEKEQNPPPKMKSLFQKSAFFVAFFFGFFQKTFAEDFETEVGSVADFGEFLSKVWSWAAEVIFGVAVLAIVIGGIVMMTGGGGEEKTTLGKTTIKGGVGSILIVLFSAVFQKFLAKPTADISGKNLSETSVVIVNTINLFLGIVGALAAAGIVFAGFQHLTSAGDEEKIEKAKKNLKMSLFGAGIALTAFSLLKFLSSIWK